MGSDLGKGAVKRRAGDSNVAASAAMFEPFSVRPTERTPHQSRPNLALTARPRRCSDFVSFLRDFCRAEEAFVRLTVDP